MYTKSINAQRLVQVHNHGSFATITIFFKNATCPYRALLWSLFLAVLEVYAFILCFSHIGQHTFKVYYFPDSAHSNRYAWVPAVAIRSDGDSSCRKSQCSTSGMQDTLWISVQRAYNWLRIRVLAAVDRSGPSEINSNFRYLRCWRILPKYFLFLKKSPIFCFPPSSFFQSNKSQRNFKNKIYFQNKIFSVDHRRNSCFITGSKYIH